MSQVVEQTAVKTIRSLYPEVGSAVILNDVEQPSGRMVCVITAIQGDKVCAKYLNANEQFDSYNKRGLKGNLRDVTPIGVFGVELNVDEHNRYECKQIVESNAKYPDGDNRPWQEGKGWKWPGRPSVLALLK